MTWDNGRELKTFTKDNVTTTYNYDSNGMRVRKNGANGNTQYYYDSNNMLVGTHFDNNTPSNKNDDTVVQFYYDTEGSPTSFRVNNSAPYFYVKNLQGDIEKIIEPNGAVKVTYTYDAKGNVTSVTDNTTNSLSTLNPLRYRGYIYDTESGLYYLQSRYYDPQIGRFLNADVYLDTETGSPLSTNMFAYCENNAVCNVDITGFKTTKLKFKVKNNASVYIIYYNKRGNGFQSQSKHLYYTNRTSKITRKGVITKEDFRKAWNSIPYGTDYVFILLHGYIGTISLDGDNQEIKKFPTSGKKPYKSKSIDCAVYLFTCCGAKGIKNSIAAKLAKLTPYTPVYAFSGFVAYNINFIHGYYARPDNDIPEGSWYRFEYTYYQGGNISYWII